MPGRIRGQLLKGTTTLLVLTVLREGELYGYEIAQRIRDNSGGAFVPNEGSLYPTLHALEADGALEASWREGDRGPRRRYYKITETGLGMLEEHAQEWAAFSLGMSRAAAAPKQ
jgi:DNA-binding PadR family transcriptional regulator